MEGRLKGAMWYHHGGVFVPKIYYLPPADLHYLIKLDVNCIFVTADNTFCWYVVSLKGSVET
jgi:hypothetical protein